VADVGNSYKRLVEKPQAQLRILVDEKPCSPSIYFVSFNKTRGF